MLGIFYELDIDGNGELTKDELKQSLENPEIIEILAKNDIGEDELAWLFDVLDKDNSETLSISEFVDGVMSLKSSEQARDLVSMQ